MFDFVWGPSPITNIYFKSTKRRLSATPLPPAPPEVYKMIKKENVVRQLFAVYKTNIYFLDLKVYIGSTPLPP